jgi:sugar phosphate isomerase/epimerase
MDISICSFSFHRLLAAGKQDIFQYIKDCQALGCTYLDPWNAHLAPIRSGDDVLYVGQNPGQTKTFLTAADDDYLVKIKAVAQAAGLPFGCIAADGAHIYDDKPDARKANRARAYRWIDVAHKLGAKFVRIDAGGPEDMPADVYAIIKEGYADVIAFARARGVEILVENHWGPSCIPGNVVRMMEDIPGLGLLWDSHNWKAGLMAEGRTRTVKYARVTHIKSFAFDAQGNEITPGEDVAAAIKMLKQAGYKGCWGVESVPKDGEEIKGARETIALIKRLGA